MNVLQLNGDVLMNISIFMDLLSLSSWIKTCREIHALLKRLEMRKHMEFLRNNTPVNIRKILENSLPTIGFAKDFVRRICGSTDTKIYGNTFRCYAKEALRLPLLDVFGEIVTPGSVTKLSIIIKNDKDGSDAINNISIYIDREIYVQHVRIMKGEYMVDRLSPFLFIPRHVSETDIWEIDEKVFGGKLEEFKDGYSNLLGTDIHTSIKFSMKKVGNVIISQDFAMVTLSRVAKNHMSVTLHLAKGRFLLDIIKHPTGVRAFREGNLEPH